MAYIPYGYRIDNGRAVVDPTQAEQIHMLVNLYLGGLSQRDAARKAGITIGDVSIKRILTSDIYLGTDLYPPILTDEEHAHAVAEQALRKCPENTAVTKPYTAACRFLLVMSEEAFHPGMNRYDVIEALYCLLEPSDNGHRSASDEERTWIKNRLANCTPMPDEKKLFLFHEQAHDKYQHQLSEKEQEKLIRQEYIRELRTRFGYSRRRLSKEVGVSESTLFLIEHGKMAASNSIMERIETRFPNGKNL